MRIVVGCPSYKRSRLLGRAIHCFNQQTHTDSEMVIIEDSGAVPSQSGDRWQLHGIAERYANLGAKRNAVVAMASPECRGYMVLDDDDVIWPGAIAAVSKALEKKPWAQCRLVYETHSPGKLMVVKAFEEKTVKPGGWGYGGCWAYRLKEFRQVGGYFNSSVSDDIRLARKFYDKFGPSADSSEDGPWYWYNREPSGWKISDEGNGFWEKRATYPGEVDPQLQVGWNGPNMYEWEIMPGIHPRPF